LIHNESAMKRSAAVPIERKLSSLRVSVPVTREMLDEIDSKANRSGMSRSAFLARILRCGLEAERQKRDDLARKIRQYRDCADPAEAARLGDELGEMIFGR
jgi:hypothetical protein